MSFSTKTCIGAALITALVASAMVAPQEAHATPIPECPTTPVAVATLADCVASSSGLQFSSFTALSELKQGTASFVTTGNTTSLFLAGLNLKRNLSFSYIFIVLEGFLPINNIVQPLPPGALLSELVLTPETLPTFGPVKVSAFIQDDPTVNTINTVTHTITQTPGPLPILGAGAAFGISRKLRRRIRLAA